MEKFPQKFSLGEYFAKSLGHWQKSLIIGDWASVNEKTGYNINTGHVLVINRNIPKCYSKAIYFSHLNLSVIGQDGSPTFKTT